MSDSVHLLTLPMEIRCHIYSFLYIEHHGVNFVTPKLCYTKTALYLSCQQLYQETLEYYYGRNTFRLFLPIPHFPSRVFFARHFDLVKVLRIDPPTFLWNSSPEGQDSWYAKEWQQEVERYLEAILEANKGASAPNLKTLIIADQVVPKRAHCYWGVGVDNLKEKLEEFVQMFEKFQIGVGQVVVDIKEVWDG